jgi:DNA (cytosine-5)-methyltransferase 1
MSAWYNEHDRYAAQWLRNLIAAGELPPGEVDERDIRDVRPVELVPYAQCHFFAGIGVWPRALRDAGWPDSRPVWTGSCPCQPFSQAGRGEGFADERHLWPAWDWLIGQSAPEFLFGEQVEGPDGLAWLDLVFSDLEARGYACGAAVFPAAGVGAPHIRSRTYWMAHANDRQRKQSPGRGPRSGEAAGGRPYSEPTGRGDAGGLADAGGDGRQGRLSRGPDQERGVFDRSTGCDGATGGLGVTDRAGSQPGRLTTETARHGYSSVSASRGDRPGPVNGLWRDADWLFCRDGYWRPVEPGTFPLAHGAPARVGRLRAYGNAIVLPQATAFVEAAMAVNAPAASPPQNA